MVTSTWTARPVRRMTGGGIAQRRTVRKMGMSMSGAPSGTRAGGWLHIVGRQLLFSHRNFSKKVFGPNFYVGAGFQLIDMFEQSCRLKLGAA